METLQSVVLPSLDVPGDESLYVRANERALCERGRRCVRFATGGDLWTDTFYGALTVSAWKKSSPVRTLLLELEGEGEFVASVGVHRLGFALTWLGEQTVKLEAGVPVRVPVDGWDRVDDGLLFLRLRALTDGELRAARYRTDDPAPNDVRLGLVVTHFNRQAQVLPAIRRIRRQVLQHPDVQGRITLTVVDNSQNLTLADGDGVTRIANRNLGGSGGFARGLLSLTDDGRTTHCLFMDDDASCEADAVLRTYALLRYAAQPRLAIAGALLAEAEPWKLLEKGACFDGKCWPLHHGRDVRDVTQLMWSERTRERADYGGWWFFAFPIREVRQYPFPFFVRGDDVFFSLANRFEILTLNGIACLGEEFGVKHGPMTSYLDSRYHLIHAVLRQHGRGRMLRRLVNNQFLKPLFAYHYASARGFTLALRHVAQGPRFFRENLDMAAVRTEIGRWQPAEKLQPVDLAGVKLRPAKHIQKENPLRKAFRALTLQGFLLPRALLRKRVLVAEKSFYGRASAVFRFRRVYYQHVQTDTGYIAEHDKRRFYGEIGDCARALVHFVRRIPDLRREYAEELPKLASEAFWRDVYALPARGTGTTAAAQALPTPPAHGTVPPGATPGADLPPVSVAASAAATSRSAHRTPARTG